jgi:hypothetical protein
MMLLTSNLTQGVPFADEGPCGDQTVTTRRNGMVKAARGTDRG